MAGRSEAVIDASIAVKWFNEEEGTKTALKIRDEHIAGATTLSAPDILLYELANALRFKPGFDAEKVTKAISDILDLQIDLITPSVELLLQSTDAAFQYEATIYDSCYLALGELMGIEVYTADQKFYNAAKSSGILKLV